MTIAVLAVTAFVALIFVGVIVGKSIDENEKRHIGDKWDNEEEKYK